MEEEYEKSLFFVISRNTMLQIWRLARRNGERDTVWPLGGHPRTKPGKPDKESSLDRDGAWPCLALLA
eukprot:scaffold336178_cov28-Prasinocladus_malaysianus.AAC.1